MSKRILILSASAGAGHLRAADALLKVFKTHPAVTQGGEVQHWDMLKYTSALFRHIYSQVYLDLANKAPGVLGWVYEKTDTPWKNEKARLAFEKFNAGPFISALTDYKPDLLVCTHFTPPSILSHLFEKRELRIKPVVVVTDLDLHAQWLVRHYERYFVALDETRIYLERLGISPSRITVAGIPIDPVFSVPKDRLAMRKHFGLDPEKFTILVSAGGFGVGPIETMVQELLRLKHPAQIVAIAGKSEELRAKLEKLAADVPLTSQVRLRPIGFTTQMDEYMAAADILISKPGGLTTSEAMARGLPLCIVNPIPGQEERNSDHLLEAGVAIRSNNPPALSWKLDQLIANPARLLAMRDAALRFAKPRAAHTIAETLLS